ncbi:MAG: hypothetical protein EBZ58_12475 [Bacteroidetes bacterium]|nr:hypothetical protein [Bacteroidota bacterium]
MLPCNTYAYMNTKKSCPASICSFIDTYGREGRANYFSDKSPNELHDMKELVPVGEVYRVC